MAKVVIDPITRIEGHLRADLEVDGGRVRDARVGGEMFRGFENILVGRNPVDAQHITQRICGVCPASHAQASTLNLDSAFGITPPKNGRLIRNLILGANFIQSHVLHFYHLAALDYVDITAIAEYRGTDRGLLKLRDWVRNGLKQAKAGEPVALGPFLPRYEGKGFYIEDRQVNIELIAHYLRALWARRKAQEMLAVFGGKMPHEIAVVPGGATQAPTVDRIVSYKMRLVELLDFIDNVYVPDAIALAKLFPAAAKTGVSYGNYLAYGVFEENEEGTERFLPSGVVKGWKLEDFNPAKIAEYVKHSRYSSPSGLHPRRGQTDPQPDKAGAYSWLKAPRYDGEPMEVGPAARMVVAYLRGHPRVRSELDRALREAGLGLRDLNSTVGRHLARAVECKVVAHKLLEYVNELQPGAPFHTPFAIPKEASGMGLTEAPRGALGHWITIRNSRIASYQCVVPTTWNASPRDDRGKPGPMERALLGAPVGDPKAPIEPARVVRSFDPCIACAVHLLEGGRQLAALRVC